mmetsp:Transcript_11600/g.40000  ORF Transcript_11600/g.40000 Transcript_11600/m.40000 type:complete len:105 (-) Transcript_11600:1716-2030(-)
MCSFVSLKHRDSSEISRTDDSRRGHGLIARGKERVGGGGGTWCSQRTKEDETIGGEAQGESRLGSRGNMDASRMLSSPRIVMVSRSNPSPAPACGEPPYLKELM